MTGDTWSVQIGAVDDPTSPGIPPVPTTVYDGAEAGARAAYDEHVAEAEASNYRYVMLRHVGEVLEVWGTPPAVG